MPPFRPLSSPAARTALIWALLLSSGAAVVPSARGESTCQLCGDRGGSDAVAERTHDLTFIPAFADFGAALGVQDCAELLAGMGNMVDLLTDPASADRLLGMEEAMSYDEACASLQALGVYCGCAPPDPPCRLCADGDVLDNPGSTVDGTVLGQIAGFAPTCELYVEEFLPSFEGGTERCDAYVAAAVGTCSCGAKPQNPLLTGPLPPDEVNGPPRIEAEESERHAADFPSAKFAQKTDDFGVTRHLQASAAIPCRVEPELHCTAPDGGDCNGYKGNGGVVKVKYYYVPKNVGTEPVTLTELTTVRHGTSENLLSDIANPKLAPGESITLVRSADVDLSLGPTLYEATLSTSAEYVPYPSHPNLKGTCFSEATEQSIIGSSASSTTAAPSAGSATPCRIELGIKCTAPGGADCDGYNGHGGLVRVTYYYMPKNVGSETVTLTELATVRHGTLENLFPSVADPKLAPGESITLVRSKVVNLSLGPTLYETTLSSKAEYLPYGPLYPQYVGTCSSQAAKLSYIP